VRSEMRIGFRAMDGCRRISVSRCRQRGDGHRRAHCGHGAGPEQLSRGQRGSSPTGDHRPGQRPVVRIMRNRALLSSMRW
jgi:hypothetical protein